ncbi:pirin family protein [Methylomonas sp. LW13]|uniref:pirin family protein n=1 Tax=unclassified Methylomonas TaxID=2608980 RepID=UPI00051BC21C|nr:pirin family protein [Methylomonas sp. LW13]QBC28907.1 pirin family protein [Methylomonas sp. LW13]
MNTDTVKNDEVMRSRAIEQLVVGHATSDGAGVKLTRVLGQSLQLRLDPFLMLDAFGSDKPNDYIAGFPNHPHRGFETLTYLITGRMRHSDNAGHQGLLETGGIQWMTAGRGIIHSEMPEQKDGMLEGFQLWINLPAAEKMQPAGYQDVQSEQIPELLKTNGVKVRVIAGSSHGVAGAVQRPDTEPLFLDVHLPAGASFSQSLAVGHNAFFYVYRGEVAVAERSVAAQRMAVLSSGESDGVILQAKQDSHLILVAGKPLHEPIAQHGPFVMNTREQIEQAIDDYQAGRFNVAA